MPVLLRALLTLFLLVPASVAVAQTSLAPGPAVTEFLARNGSGLVDEDGDHSDWIEIHNVPGAGPLDLGGWALTDDPSDPHKWIFFPGTNLAEGGFLVVFASDKDRRDPNGTLHTSFRLSGSGEFLALTDPSGAFVSEYSPQYPAQFEDVSYGFSFNPAPTTAERFFSSPTPGAANGGGGPPATAPSHSPQRPTDTEDVIVTIEAPTVTAAPPTVTLTYRVMFGSNATAPMRDDGVAPDAVAGDEVFTGAIPAAASDPGEMVRWKIDVQDSLGSTRLPTFPDPTGSPEWFGTVVEDPSLAASQIDVWEWFVASPFSATTATGTRCSVWIEGRFYDNVKVSRRGSSSAGYPRKSFKFDFNPGHRPVLAAIGVEIDEANINTHYADKAHVRQMLAYRLLGLVGSNSSVTFPIRLQQNGDFYSVQTFIEEPDRFFLERAGEDPNGALYKMYNTFSSGFSGVEKVTRTFEGNQDLQDFVTTVNQGGPGLEDYLFDALDVPRVISYLVGLWLFHENDHVHKNYYLYRDTDGDGEWQFIPWDKDLTWGRNFSPFGGGVLNDQLTASHPVHSHVLLGDQQHPNTDNFWNRLIDKVYASPRLREMYLRRLRTVCDERLQPPGTPLAERFMEAYFADAEALLAPDLALDEARWGLPSWGTPRNFQAAVARLLSGYVEPRRSFFYGPQQAANGGLVPAAEGGRTALRITAVEISPTSGDPAEQYIEVTNDAAWAADLSGFTLDGPATMTLPQGTVIEAGGRLFLAADVAAFRARSTAPHGGQGHFVIGPFEGTLVAGEKITLRDHEGRARARR